MSNANIDRELQQKIYALNRLKDYRYTPENIVMVAVEDMVELMYEIQPYTMERLDEIQRREELLAL